ncbi:hypothetical protein JDV02_008567 [Purpureocillium takamizusanense]|uniref:JmjC domain-containing protein n=1 Tax=Purpureocillium takamizusanense TaxID=2060973 RepID=A0A9Q8QKG8_9HYPO|nr:uncharacterized protein JDV02_008567 [Purpureocillium takamizusanense]UNI22704.1 hypothetical protein JDV02_008567 [Purpureocillium takamizusanense]
MRRTISHRTTWNRLFHGISARRQRNAVVRAIEVASSSVDRHPDIHAFQQKALIPEKPLVFRHEAGSPTSQLQAAAKWFTQDESGRRVLTSHVTNFDDWPFPYELVQSSSQKKDAVISFRDWLMKSSAFSDQMMAGILQTAITEGDGRQFSQLYGPLQLLIKALEFNKLQDAKGLSTLELYIAQSMLSDLPQPLQHDLCTPELVRGAGKGDVYSSSVWLGTEPTYTPLHRDPNPNLFCQLCGDKLLRILPPTVGDRLYFEVQVKIRQRGNSRIRTTEMMEGDERAVLHDAVWDNDELADLLLETELRSGDAVFIPDGWWHSVKSAGAHGQLNGSANWWFR